MMIRFLAIWLADRCGLFEETEAAANAYLQTKSAYDAAEEHWRSRLAEAQEKVKFYSGMTASYTDFQAQIAQLVGVQNDNLDISEEQARIVRYLTEVSDSIAIQGFNDRAFLGKLVTILIGSDAVCAATPVDVQRSTVIDAAEELVGCMTDIATIASNYSPDRSEEIKSEIRRWKSDFEDSRRREKARTDELAALQDLMQAQRSAWENGAVNQQLQNLAESQESLFEHLESISHAVGLNPKTKDGKSIDVPAILAKIDEYKKPKPLALGGASGAIAVRHLAPNQGL